MSKDVATVEVATKDFCDLRDLVSRATEKVLVRVYSDYDGNIWIQSNTLDRLDGGPFEIALRQDGTWSLR